MSAKFSICWAVVIVVTTDVIKLVHNKLISLQKKGQMIKEFCIFTNPTYTGYKLSLTMTTRHSAPQLRKTIFKYFCSILSSDAIKDIFESFRNIPLNGDIRYYGDVVTDICPICLEHIQLYPLKTCPHGLCLMCFYNLITNGHIDCPTCRSSILPNCKKIDDYDNPIATNDNAFSQFYGCYVKKEFQDDHTHLMRPFYGMVMSIAFIRLENSSNVTTMFVVVYEDGDWEHVSISELHPLLLLHGREREVRKEVRDVLDRIKRFLKL